MVRLLVVRGTKISKRELVRIFYHDASVTAIEEVLRTLEAMGHATLSYEGSEVFIELKPGRKHAS
jgi:sorbitol-specific phosphotransferase system component IIA